MLTCSLPKSILAQAKLLVGAIAALAFTGQGTLAQSPVHYPPVQLIAPAVTTYQLPAGSVAAPPAGYVPAQVVAPAIEYTQPARGTYVAPRRSKPTSMSRSSFSQRWAADLKVSGRGFRP